MRGVGVEVGRGVLRVGTAGGFAFAFRRKERELRAVASLAAASIAS